MKVGDIIVPHGGYKTTMKMPIEHITKAKVIKIVGNAESGQQVVEIKVLETCYNQTKNADIYGSYIDRQTKTASAEAHLGFYENHHED